MFRRLRSATLDDLWVSLLVVVIGGLALLTGLYWLTGQVAGRLFGGAWPQVGFVEMGGVMIDALRHPADPTAAWPPAAQELLPGPVGFYAVMFVFFLLPTLVLLGFVAVRLRARRPLRGAPPAPVGTAGAASRPGSRRRGLGWARARDLRKLQVRPGGEPGRLILGRVEGKLIAAEPGQAVIILGPPGSGKTAGLVTPAVLEWEGPVVVATASPELVLDTARRRGELGGVWAFDPGGVSPLPRAAWSPLDVAATWEDALRTAGSLVTAAAPAAPEGGGRGPDTAGLLAPLLFAANRSYLGLGELARWAQRQDRDEVAAVLGAAGEPAAADAFEAVWRLPEPVRAELYDAAGQVLAPWTDPRVRRALGSGPAFDGPATGNGNRHGQTPELAAEGFGTRDPEPPDSSRLERFTPAALLDGGINTLYLLASPHELQRLRPLLVALLQEVVSAVYERAASGDGHRLDPPLLIVLDDAAEVALRSLDVHASTAGGQGVQLLSVFRNIAQVRARYGERADNVITSHRARVFLSGTTDPATLDYLANLLGDDRFRPPGAASGGPDGARRRRSRPAAQPPPRSGSRAGPADVLRSPRSAAGLLVYGYLPAAELELRPWFHDRRLRALAGSTRTPGRSRSRQPTPMSGRRPPKARDVFPDLPAPSSRRNRPPS